MSVTACTPIHCEKSATPKEYFTSSYFNKIHNQLRHEHPEFNWNFVKSPN